jgi:hypothetical protein
LLLDAVNALEILYFENLALNKIVERWSLPNWKSERDHVVNDPCVQPDVRGVFDRFRSEMEEVLISDSTLQQLAWVMPVTGKPI